MHNEDRFNISAVLKMCYTINISFTRESCLTKIILQQQHSQSSVRQVAMIAAEQSHL